jgi:phospholipid-binding lipoprotein MlaA
LHSAVDCRTVALFLSLALAVAGCGTVSRATDAEPLRLTSAPSSTGDGARGGATATPPDAPRSVDASDVVAEVPLRLTDEDDTRYWPSAQARATAPADAVEPEEYDPWESFNEKMFAFNRNLDRFVLKPAARVYRVVMPEPFQLLVENGFDNLRFVPRAVNSLLQAKWGGAGREVARFLINSTAGIGGIFDPAKNYWGIEKSREDFGQTLGVYGAGAGPYLILPLLPPLTVRDGIGMAVDGALDPLSYVLPFFWDRLGMRAGDTLNDRAINYELFQGFEESVIDMYSAVRHGYLRRREQLIKE